MKINSLIRTRKLTIILTGTNEEKKEMKTYMVNLINDMTKIGNLTIRNMTNHLCNINEIKENDNISKGDAIKYYSQFKNNLIPQQIEYHNLTHKYPIINSRTIALLTNSLWKTLDKNFYDIMTGKMSIPSFTTTKFPIPVELTINKIDKYYSFNLPMSLKGRKINTTPNFQIFFGKDKSNNEIIVERILDNTYKLKTSTIQFNKDKKFILNLTYEQPHVINHTPDPNKIMGIDIGINRPISFFITNKEHQPKQINLGLKIQHERLVYKKRKESLQQSSKFSIGGHGRNRKLQSLNTMREKEKNWADTMSHALSSELIKMALNNKVSIIKMEDLTDITKDKNDYFLKSWGYYKLQEYIRYKAIQQGIQVLFVDPKNTSITCSTCNTIDKENRNDKDKTIFKCTNFLCEDYDKIKDADINAAKNISVLHGTEERPKSKKGKLNIVIQKKQQQEKHDILSL